jgi:hypothetical protein
LESEIKRLQGVERSAELASRLFRVSLGTLRELLREACVYLAASGNFLGAEILPIDATGKRVYRMASSGITSDAYEKSKKSGSTEDDFDTSWNLDSDSDLESLSSLEKSDGLRATDLPDLSGAQSKENMDADSDWMQTSSSSAVGIALSNGVFFRKLPIPDSKSIIRL